MPVRSEDAGAGDRGSTLFLAARHLLHRQRRRSRSARRRSCRRRRWSNHCRAIDGADIGLVLVVGADDFDLLAEHAAADNPRPPSSPPSPSPARYCRRKGSTCRSSTPILIVSGTAGACAQAAPANKAAAAKAARELHFIAYSVSFLFLDRQPDAKYPDSSKAVIASKAKQSRAGAHSPRDCFVAAFLATDSGRGYPFTSGHSLPLGRLNASSPGIVPTSL